MNTYYILAVFAGLAVVVAFFAARRGPYSIAAQIVYYLAVGAVIACALAAGAITALSKI